MPEAYNQFVNGYRDRIAIALKENWDGELTQKKAPTNAEFRQWADELINTHDSFTYKDDKGVENKITMQMLQMGVDNSAKAKEKLDQEFRTHELDKVLLTRGQLDASGKQVEKAADSAQGGLGLLLNLIMGFIDWMMGGFQPGKDGGIFSGLMESIAKRNVNSVTNSLTQSLEEETPSIHEGVREAIVKNVRSVASGSPAAARRTLEETAVGPALAQTTPDPAPQVTSNSGPQGTVRPDNPATGTDRTPSRDPVPQTSPDPDPAPRVTTNTAPTSNPATQGTVQPDSPAAGRELALHEKQVIAGALTAVSLVDFTEAAPKTEIGRKDMVKVAADMKALGGIISFYNDTSKNYEPLKDSSVEALQEAISNDKSRRISVTVGQGDGRTTRYFEQILQADREDSPTGFAAASYLEVNKEGKYLDQKGKVIVDDKNVALDRTNGWDKDTGVFRGVSGKVHDWVAFPGYTGDIGTPGHPTLKTGESDHTPQSKSLEEITVGRLNPQSAEAAAFMDSSINKIGKNNLDGVLYGAHSMGASNALVARATGEMEGVKSVVFVELEQAAATLAAREINEAIHDPNSSLHQTLVNLHRPGVTAESLSAFNGEFNRDTHSVRVSFTNASGKPSETAVATLVPANKKDGILPKDGIYEGLKRQYLGIGDPRIDNGSLGVATHVDITGQGLAKPEIEGHQLRTIITALNQSNHAPEVAEAGQRVRTVGMTGGGATAGPGGSRANVTVAVNTPIEELAGHKGERSR